MSNISSALNNDINRVRTLYENGMISQESARGFFEQRVLNRTDDIWRATAITDCEVHYDAQYNDRVVVKVTFNMPRTYNIHEVLKDILAGDGGMVELGERNRQLKAEVERLRLELAKANDELAWRRDTAFKRVVPLPTRKLDEVKG